MSWRISWRICENYINVYLYKYNKCLFSFNSNSDIDYQAGPKNCWGFSLRLFPQRIAHEGFHHTSHYESLLPTQPPRPNGGRQLKSAAQRVIFAITVHIECRQPRQVAIYFQSNMIYQIFLTTDLFGSISTQLLSLQNLQMSLLTPSFDAFLLVKGMEFQLFNSINLRHQMNHHDGLF